MAERFLRAVLFDLGGTLMYPRDPWAPVLERGDRALADFLCAQGIDLNCRAFPRQLRERLDEYYARREQDLFETTYLFILRELLEEQGYPGIPEQALRAALDKMYAVTQSNWVLEEDALLTLRILETAGYRLGLVSNAGDDKDVFELAEQFGIEPYFDFILTSAACSYRKPHPRIFELALAHWGTRAEEVAMVGDTLEADIHGANRAGLFSIWITRRVEGTDADQAVQPNAVISSLIELPGLLNSLA